MPARIRKIDWASRAAELARLVPRDRLHPAVVARADAGSPRQTWGVGFSGGADSLALLLLLWAHWPRRRPSLRALHFDHRLRGAESTADARFCREVCRQLGVAFVSARWRRPPRSAAPSEAEARTARLAFFRTQARLVWFGHQQDDIAESMLMRLARGSGSGGLAAPRPVQRFADGREHLRPLLTLKKAEIVAALRAAQIEWREDASNALATFFRNRIRQDVVPVWVAAARRDALAGAARSRALLEEDDAALEAWLDGLDAIERGGTLRLGVLAGQPRAIVRRALQRWLGVQRWPVDISSQAFELLLGAVERGQPTRMSLGPELFGVIGQEELRLGFAGKNRRKFRRRAN